MSSRFLRMITLVCSALQPLAAGAQAFPQKPIKLVVPFAPGGSTDLVARMLAERMGPLLGQPVTVDNRAGAGGTVGADLVAKSAPDGYTLLMGTVSTHGASPAIYKKIPYDPIKDFQPVTNVMSVPSVFVVHPKVPARTMKEFMTLTKAALLPDVPTYRELGFEDMAEGGWFGLLAPASTPPAVVNRLREAAHRAMEEPAFKAQAEKIGGISMAGTPEEFAQQIKVALARYQRVARVANIQPD